MLHLELGQEIRSLWSIAELQCIEYKRDNSVEASSNFWLHQVAMPLPDPVLGGALRTRDMEVNDQSVYTDLSIRLDSTHAVIAAFISWRGCTDISPAANEQFRISLLFG